MGAGAGPEFTDLMGWAGREAHGLWEQQGQGKDGTRLTCMAGRRGKSGRRDVPGPRMPACGVWCFLEEPGGRTA